MRFALSDMVPDVPTIVAQMDETVRQLREAWSKIDSKWVIMWTSQTADAADARLASLKSLIDDLDVGGVARQHVFFPLDGQTADEAWAAWVDTAQYVRDGLAQVGSFISSWNVTTVLPKIAQQVQQEGMSLATMVMWGIGGLLALEVLRTVRGARGAMAGYRRRRRSRR